MKRRILATLLSLCLVVGMLPVTAMAEENCVAVKTEEELLAAISKATGTKNKPVEITLEKDIQITNPISFSEKFILLQGANSKIKLYPGEQFSNKMTLIQVGEKGNSGTLESPSSSLSLKNITIDMNRSGQAIKVTKAELNLLEGSTIQNCYYISDGGPAFYLSNQASANMYSGATLQYNETSKNGGAICIWPDGVFRMFGGTINGNKGNYGGAIWNSGGQVFIEGGTISENTGGDYGVIGNQANSTCFIDSKNANDPVRIIDNTNIKYRSGVFGNNGSTLSIKGALFQDNTAGNGVQASAVMWGGPSNEVGSCVIENCKFVGNSSPIVRFQATATIGNNTMDRTQSVVLGGAVLNLSQAVPEGSFLNLTRVTNGHLTEGDKIVQGLNYTLTSNDLARTVFSDDIPTPVYTVYLDKEDNCFRAKVAKNITFNAAYGESPATLTQVVPSGIETALKENTFTRDGYTFAGWNTAQDGTGTAYADGAEITTSEDLTLYAQWTPKHYSISYELNGGTNGESAPTTHTYGTATELVSPSRTGYTFDGWYTNNDFSGSKVESLGATDYVNDITLYAQWTPNPYTIQFNANGGDTGTGTASVAATYDQPATLTANGFSMANKNFAGWATTESATTATYADGATVENLAESGTVTLYAVWTDKQVLTPDKSVQTKTYNGAAQAFTLDGYTIAYQQNGQPVTAPTNAGSYDVVISAAETETTAAYPETLIPGGLVIEKATLTVTADNKTMYVSDALPTYTYTVSGWQGSDKDTATFTAPTLSCSADGKTAGTYTITAGGANAGGNYNISYVDGTLTVYTRSSGGGSSSSSSTTTTKNPDGSTTTTTTNKTTGTVTEVTKAKDGTTTTVETKKDGTVTETVKLPDGTTGTVVTDKNGNVTEVKASVSSTAVKEAAKTGEAVTLPVEVPAAKTTEDAPAVQVTVPKSAGSVKVEVPVEKVTSGTVAVIVKADGTEEIVKTSALTEDGVVLKLDGSATVKVIDNAKDFSDTNGHWAEDAISFVTAREMFAGTSATTFTPNSQMTRAQLMTVLARFDGVDTNGGSVWYEKGMEWAKANGVSDGSNPNGSITREQLATMLWRYSGSPAVEGGLDRFNDAGKVSGYATDAMRWAVETGLISGVGNDTLAPQGNATRAQLATILMRYCENIVK